MRLIFLIIILLVIQACVQKSPSGYFKGINNSYYRISYDTVAEYRVLNQQIDSTVSYWNGSAYTTIIDRLGNTTQHYGDGKIVWVNDNQIIFDITKSQEIIDKRIEGSPFTTEQINAMFITANNDTLTKISKKYFYHFLESDRKKDSLLFHKPYIDDYTIENSVSQFIKDRIEGEVYGKLIDNSIIINRINDDSFRVRFKTIHDYGIKEDHRFIFDANMENWSIKRER